MVAYVFLHILGAVVMCWAVIRIKRVFEAASTRRMNIKWGGHGWAYTTSNPQSFREALRLWAASDEPLDVFLDRWRTLVGPRKPVGAPKATQKISTYSWPLKVDLEAIERHLKAVADEDSQNVNSAEKSEFPAKWHVFNWSGPAIEKPKGWTHGSVCSNHPRDIFVLSWDNQNHRYCNAPGCGWKSDLV